MTDVLKWPEILIIKKVEGGKIMFRHKIDFYRNQKNSFYFFLKTIPFSLSYFEMIMCWTTENHIVGLGFSYISIFFL